MWWPRTAGTSNAPRAARTGRSPEIFSVMLSTLLLAGLFAAPIGTAALFLPASRRARRAEKPAQRAARLTAALACSAVVIAIVAVILALIGVTPGHLEAAIVGLAVACLVWLPVTRRWNARAHVSWATTTYVFVVYLAFMAWWTFASHLGITGDVGGMLLWLLELVAAVLGCAYLWELCDTLGRASWVRRVGTQELAEMPDGPYPSVCLQVPCYNEPPDMVIQRLESLRLLDYPNYEIQVLDDNTNDEALWRPVEAWCKEHDVKFVHLSDWPGYKSGALNYALQNMVESSCELIGVVDSDYQIDPQFLRRCAPCSATRRWGSSRRRRTIGIGRVRRSTGASTTPTSTSSRSPSPRATSETARSSPVRWGSFAATPWSRPAGGTSGASPRTPSSRCGFCATDGRACTWTSRSARGSCRSPSRG